MVIAICHGSKPEPFQVTATPFLPILSRGEATSKGTLVHCLSNLHNFIKTYGKNKAVEWQKKKLP
jgi:hypothetical protein